MLLSEDSRRLIQNLFLYKIKDTYFEIPDIIFNWSNDIIMMYQNLMIENKLLENSEMEIMNHTFKFEDDEIISDKDKDLYFSDNYPKVVETIKYLHSNKMLHNIVNKDDDLDERARNIKYLEDIYQNKPSIDEIYEWINGDGKKIVRDVNDILHHGEIDETIENNIYVYRNIYSHFCPVEIQQFIELKLQKNNMFKIVLPNSGSVDNMNTNNILLNLNLVTNEEIIQFPKIYKDINKIPGNNPKDPLNLSFIVARCLLIHALHSVNTTNRVINLFVYTTPFKKMAQSMDDSLGPLQVNSAFQYRDTMIIFRNEELMKSILHESIHHAHLDNHLEDNNEINAYIRKHMAVDDKSDIRVYEAFTETIANVFNVIVTLYEMIMIRKDSLQSHHELLERFITLEQVFACFQTAKILNFYGFDSFEEFLSPGTTDKRILQETSVLSYYVIKGGFITSLDKFMEKYNPEIVDLSVKLDSNDYIDLVKTCVIENKGYHALVNNMMKIKVEDTFTALSLRMTLLEL